MELVGQLSAAELGDMIAQSSHYRSFAPEDLPEDYPDRQAGLTVHVMRHNGVWKRATSNAPEFFDWKGAEFDHLDAAYDVARPDPSGAAANAFGSQFRVELTHFDQREFQRGRGAPMGSTTGTGTPKAWLGTGYYTVFIDNAPALRFRIEDDQEVLSGSHYVRLNVEGGAAFDWIAITHFDQAGTREVIIVSRPNETDDAGDQAGSARRPSSSRAAARR
jgi:hypothetical protein